MRNKDAALLEYGVLKDDRFGSGKTVYDEIFRDNLEKCAAEQKRVILSKGEKIL